MRALLPSRWPSLRRLPLLLCLTAWLIPQVSLAQSVNIGDSSLVIDRAQERPSGQFPLWINRQDCLDANADDPTIVNLTVGVQGANSQMNLQLWGAISGQDCTEDDNRNGANPQCFQLFSENAAGSVSRTIELSPRKIVEAALKSDGQAVTGTEQDCNADLDQAIVLYAMLVQGQEIQGSPATWNATAVDLVAPPPPTNLLAFPGDGRIFAEWEVDVADERNDTLGFTIWCAPASATSATSAGQGGAGGAGSSCSAGALRAGGFVEDDRYRCASPNGTSAREANASVDSNETTYAVAVSSRDDVGNESALSNVVCATPQAVTTFFESYRRSGGQGGGGFCEMRRQPTGWWSAFVLLALVGLLQRRMRRRR